jgi:hypothetical protein
MVDLLIPNDPTFWVAIGWLFGTVMAVVGLYQSGRLE